MKKLYVFLLVLFPAVVAVAQQAAAIDSIKSALAKAVTIEDKVYWLDNLSRTLMNVNLQQADEYGKQLISLAEESRDRKLMIKAYMSNGIRCSYYASAQDYTNRSIGFFNKALDIAKQNRLDEDIGAAYLKLSAIHLAIPDRDKALNYANQAFSVITGLKNDSLMAEANNTYGNVYLNRNEKILALRNYLAALRIAENIKNHPLIRNCYLYLSSFYTNIEDYDKAIDYSMLAYKKLDDIKEKNVPYQRAIDINSIGKLYSYKQSHDIAISYFDRSLRMADSLKFPTLKVPAYTSLLNQYLRMDQPKKALEYFNSTSGQGLKDFLTNFGFTGAIDQAYAVIYTELNQLDSARYYFDKAAPYFDNNPNEASKMYFYAQLGSFYKKTGDLSKAIELYTKVKNIADRTGQLEPAEKAAKHLDTLYARTGNFQQASIFNSIYYQYKDSIEKLNKEKELSQVEAADEQYRQQRLEEEKAEKKRRKNNIQYMAITIGIAALFIMLVVLGMFKVSAKTIRLIGFFAFIMFFEFIFLIFKKNIYSITEGEPWKDLSFMIALAALLVPLHHWLEHKVIHYLTSHNRLTSSGKTFLSKVFARKNNDEGSKT
ncbi:MAG: tetratricopeptide repeat protein [Chitinophagaceae bacterium]|nr:tetratricopeptide repeat protein [Chitinophagaceae bacterium]